MRQHMMLERKTVGNLGTNCYLFCNKDTKEAIIIDPGADAQNIYDALEQYGMTPVAILVTHGHYDHIGGIKLLAELYHSLPVYASIEDKPTLASADKNLSVMFGSPLSINADVTLYDQQEIELVGAHIRCILTPGHTPGGMCFYFVEDEILLSGDTLFAESIGRTDFPGGDSKALLDSLQKLKQLPEYIHVYPGHGPSTTIAHEVEANPYM